MRLGRCSKACSSNRALRAPRQRDEGDGVTRDKTAWTWWTLPPAISGRLAQRYRECIPVSCHSCWTSRNMRSPGLGQGRQRLVVASGCQEREIRPCSSSMNGCHRGTPRCRCGCVFPPTRVAPRSEYVLAARACNRLTWAGWRPETSSWRNYSEVPWSLTPHSDADLGRCSRRPQDFRILTGWLLDPKDRYGRWRGRNAARGARVKCYCR